jgi:transcriptional regulator with XRE-family HTH domain
VRGLLFMNSIKQQIKEARAMRGLSEEELAYKVGINVEHIKNIENGLIQPKLDLLEQISYALNYTFKIGNVSI